MLEDDYIMRLIHQMVRFILKLVFHLDDDDDQDLFLEADVLSGDQMKMRELLKHNDINGAENYLYEHLDTNRLEDFKMGLLFYDYLNQMGDEELECANYTREEILQGTKQLARLYGYEGMAEAFLS